MELWVGCVAGALEENEFKSLLADAGFEDIDIEPTRIYEGEDATTLVTGAGLDSGIAEGVDGRFMSAFIRARKAERAPLAVAAATTSSCCGDDCCK